MDKVSNKNQIDFKTKRPFNKKKWREQRYSTKAKVKQWETSKRIQAFRRYKKELKKEGIDTRSQKYTDQSRKGHPMNSVQEEFERKREEKNRIIEEKNQRKVEKERKIAAYKAKKAEVFKKLSRKTKKGQPVMKGRMELLLERIEKEYGKNNENMF